MKINLWDIINATFLFIILLIVMLMLAGSCNAQSWSGYEDSGKTDTVRAKFLVTSNVYSVSQLRCVDGYVVREIFVYTEDRIGCEDCDFTNNYAIIEYLNSKKKVLKGYTIWKYKVFPKPTIVDLMSMFKKPENDL